jgi:hypothetical protein
MKNSKWAEIRNTNFNEEEKCFTIDAWKTKNDNEEGKVIAKVFEDILIYFDLDAKADMYAQEIINETIKKIRKDV